MNIQETKEILFILQTNYPQSFKGWDKEQVKYFVELWAEAFKNDDVAIVTNAVKSIIYGSTREFAPNIGQVKDKIYQLSNHSKIDADEAWNMVSSALRNSIYHAEEEFNKLPIEVQAGVGNPSQLKEWAQMDSDTVQSVIGSNFKKGYRGRVEEKKEYEKLPLEAKQMIKQLSNGMKMIE